MYGLESGLLPVADQANLIPYLNAIQSDALGLQDAERRYHERWLVSKLMPVMTDWLSFLRDHPERLTDTCDMQREIAHLLGSTHESPGERIAYLYNVLLKLRHSLVDLWVIEHGFPAELYRVRFQCGMQDYLYAIAAHPAQEEGGARRYFEQWVGAKLVPTVRAFLVKVAATTDLSEERARLWNVARRAFFHFERDNGEGTFDDAGAHLYGSLMFLEMEVKSVAGADCS